MKRKLVALAAVMALVVLCSGCTGTVSCPAAPETPPAPESEGTLPEPVNEWTVTDGITLRLMNSEFPEGVERMTLIMENRTDQVMLYGNGWSFERYENGEWVPLPNREDAGWTSEGYHLYDHKQDIFHVSTFALAEPLTEGLYRVTGCTLRVAKDDENLSAGGNYTEYPAYQLEFAVKKDALPDRGYPEESAPPGGLLPKEDWEWYTPWEGLNLLENRGESVWQFVKDENGLVALLHRPNTPENEYYKQGDLLSLHLFDRKTGELFTVFESPFVEMERVTPEEGGGFHIEAKDGQYYAGQRDGEWVMEDWGMGGAVLYPDVTVWNEGDLAHGTEEGE